MFNTYMLITVDTDILKPNTGYLSIERPSQPSSKGTSDRPNSGSLTPEAEVDVNHYTEPVSDGEEDEDMDIGPAKDEGRRTGLTAVEVAEAIAYREKMLKEAAADEGLQRKGINGQSRPEQSSEDDEEPDEIYVADANGRTPFLRGRRPSSTAPKGPGRLSIDPLAPSSAFDQTLRERLRGAKSQNEGGSSVDDTAVNDDDDDEEDTHGEGSSREGARGDDRELIRHFKAPAGKRVSIPVRIEPKVYFAAERTFLVCYLLLHCLPRITNASSRNG